MSEATSSAPTTRRADLVLEGGGVKGIALVGAATALDEAGWRFVRVAGSSAGSIVGAIIAAMQRAGEPMTRVDEIMRTLHYPELLDRRRGVAQVLDRVWPRAADAWGVLFHLGTYRGQDLTGWVRGVLGDLGVRTFGDLSLDDPDLDPARRFALVVTASDVSRQRLMYLPWDLPAYGRDAASFPVARAVRASSAIPFMFEPVRLQGRHGTSTLLDGSLLSSYPIDAFDRTDDRPARWPTIGVRLSSPASERAPAKPVTGPVSLLSSLVYTVVDSTQVRHVIDPADVDRSIFAKPRGVRWTDFDLTAEQQQSLFDAGYKAARRWIAKHPDGPAAKRPETT